MDNKNIISVRDIVNRFGEQIVHDHLSLNVKRGEILGLVGGSGSGKSVLMRTILGLQTPQSGSVDIMGTVATPGEAEHEHNIFGVLFQNGALFSSLSTLQNVAVPLKEDTDLPEDRCDAIARMKLALVGLPPEVGDKAPSELSGGMVKRASLARALALDPPILFLDEPTAGLDPIAAGMFDDLIADLHKNLGLTVIIITHDLDTLFGICDTIAVLVDKKAVVGTLEEHLQSEHPWIKEYFHGARAEAALAGKRKREKVEV